MIISDTVIPVILSGGLGKRLWPLSRSSFPKQFLSLSGSTIQTSLFQGAVSRINQIGSNPIALKETLIVTNEDYRFIVQDQLCEMGVINATLLLEPAQCNTAPALTLAALYAQESSHDGSNDPILVITPADHTVQNEEAFISALQDCISTLSNDANKQALGIFGITPTSPKTGYGYIKVMPSEDHYGYYPVEQFTEKPNFETASTYINSGNYFWNSGIFVVRANTWLSALEEFRSDIFEATQKAWEDKTEDKVNGMRFIRPNKSLFTNIPSESIDKAVIEKCPGSKYQIKMFELNAGWNDLGAWDAVWQDGNKDGQGNVTTGDVLLNNTTNSLIHASSRLVSTIGLNGVIVIETADAVLVSNGDASQNVNCIVNQLEAQSREEKNIHRKVIRPWGWYDVIDDGENFKVKRLQVKPGGSLSLQLHHYRAEHWIVVKGTAKITNGVNVITLNANQSTYIPQGQIHRLENPGEDSLEIIEVQSGSYLGEDDIIRFEDDFGRT